MTWISVRDWKPELNWSVLLYSEHERDYYIGYLTKYEYGSVFIDKWVDTNGKHILPTHWTLLPTIHTTEE